MSQLSRKDLVKKRNISNLAFLDDTYLFHLIYDGPVRELSFPFIEGGKMDENPDFRGLKKGGRLNLRQYQAFLEVETGL